MTDWIPSQVGLRDHPKTRRLARMLDAEPPHVIGYLHCLWYWALDYAPDGDIEDFEPEDIADAAGWTGDPDIFVESLINCGGKKLGFLAKIEGRLVIHDWEDNQGDAFRARVQAAAKKRAQRAAKQGQDGNSGRTAADDVSEPRDTVPQSGDTVPQSGDTVPIARDLARAKDQTDQTDKTDRTDRQIPSGGTLPPQTAQQLVAHYVDEHRRLGLSEPSRRRVGQAAKAIKERMDAGVPPPTIAAALALAVERAKSPALLDLLVAEVEKGPPRRRESNVDRALAVVREIEQEVRL